MDVRQQFNLYGHARVLLVLKPSKPVRTGFQLSFDSAGTYSQQQDTAHDLRPHFRAFEDSREVSLATEMECQDRSSAIAESHKNNGVRYYPNLGVMLGTVDKEGLAQLRQEKQVAAIISPPELGLIRATESLALAGPPAGISWALRRIKADQAWQAGFTGEGVMIGHVDTGVDGSHPALKDRINAFVELDSVGEIRAGATAHDSARHGTHTAGIIAGETHAGLSFGVAPKAQLNSAMVIELGDVFGRVIGGLDWCVGQGVRVISISLGVRGYSTQFQAIIALLRQRNILPVVAIGNEGPATSRSPGNYPESLSVGAINESDLIWDWSSSEQFSRASDPTVPDLVAPGAEVWSSVPGGQLSAMSGTSMAAPHVAGIAALLLQKRGDLTVSELENAILNSCTRPIGVSSSRGNRGIPDAVQALSSV